MSHEKRNRKIIALYTDGATAPKLAKRYGITPARVYQIVAASGLAPTITDKTPYVAVTSPLTTVEQTVTDTFNAMPLHRRVQLLQWAEGTFGLPSPGDDSTK